MSKSYKSEQRKETVSTAVNIACEEINSLRDEMDEWASNMEDNNLSSTPKFDEVNEAKEALEEHADNEPEVPGEIQEDEVIFYEQVQKRKGRGPSRDVRLSNAIARLQAVVEHAQGKLDALDDDVKEGGEGDDEGQGLDLRDKYEEFIQQTQDIIDSLDGGVSFPSAF